MDTSNFSIRTHYSDKRPPWMVFLFIFGVFWFAEPYQLFWIIDNVPTPQESERLLQASAGNLGRQIGLIALGMFSAYMLLRAKVRRSALSLPLSLAIAVFLIWAWMSLLWSGDILFTFKRLMVLSLMWLGAAALGERLSLREVALLILFIGSITIIISLCCDIVSRIFNPFDPDYRFSGVMHPNGQAINCGLLLMASLCLARMVSRVQRWRYICVALFALLFLVLTKSRTALGASLISSALFLLMTADRRRRGMLLSGLAFLLPLTVMAIYFMVDTHILLSIKNLLLLGRETEVGTFTGRVPVWTILIKYVAKQPILGYGYDSFWTTERMSAIMASEGAWVASDHSTYLNITLGLGVIGLGIFLCILSLAFIRSFRLFGQYHDVAFAFSTSILLLMMINMFLETIWFQPYMSTFLGMIILAKIAMKDRDEGG